jgi:hypothetical protein
VRKRFRGVFLERKKTVHATVFFWEERGWASYYYPGTTEHFVWKMYSLHLKDNNNTCHTAQRWRGEGWDEKDGKSLQKVDKLYSISSHRGQKLIQDRTEQTKMYASVALTETFRYLELCSTCLKEGLGRSKPATNLRTSILTHCVGFLIYPSLTEPSSIDLNEHYKMRVS